ncbi:unnamed protein product [Diabrotica balteata]|uniref:Endonuclease-reverse transcriptase n=1 Tax=Diabrotica balteata TaxID=107213 RepID=A0A9N9XIA8_DIABA|nr:unnamed protein product [Diabrotica balteata]
MRKLLISKDLSLPLKLRIVKCYIFPILLYSVEAWTLTETLTRKLEAFEMWVYRRILHISWTEHVTNIEVLQRIGKEKEIVNTRRRHSWLQNLRKWFGLTSVELFRVAANKIKIAMLIANVRNGQGT